MKRRIAYLGLMLIIFSCSGPMDKKSGASQVGKPDAAADSLTVLPFTGYWIDSGYVQRIHKTRSPHSSQIFKEICYYFPERTMQPANVIWNFHEGGTEMNVTKDGNVFRLHMKAMTDSIQEIKLLPGGRLRVGNQDFVRVVHGDSSLYDWGVIEELLFEGKYRDTTGKTVSFEAGGRVTGLDTIAFYAPDPDYAGTREDIDLIQLGKTREKLHWYGFRFDKDSLILYRLNCPIMDSTGKECDSVYFTQQLRTLVRVQDLDKR